MALMPRGTPRSVPDAAGEAYDAAARLWNRVVASTKPLQAQARGGLEEMAKAQQQSVQAQRLGGQAIAQRMTGQVAKPKADGASRIPLRGKLDPDQPVVGPDGAYYWPLPDRRTLTTANPATRQGSGGFHSRSGGGHDGIDIIAPVGTAIYADQDGQVFRVDATSDPNGYGLQMLLGPDEKNQSRYAHLQKSLVEAGDAVKRGQVIGYTGTSGNGGGDGFVPHLHYETYVDGVRVDPFSRYPK